MPQDRFIINRVSVEGGGEAIEIEAPYLFELLKSLVVELRKANLHLASISGENINEEDTV
jgi:hypothetical protein